MKKLVVPKFAAEAQEAKWWDDHMDIVESNLFEAMRNGTAGRGIVQRLLHPPSEPQNVTLPMPPADIARARKLSQQKKVDLQTYVSALVHKALDREEAAAKRARRRKSA